MHFKRIELFGAGAEYIQILILTHSRVLSTIFCLGGKSILKKVLRHAAARKNCF